MDIGNYGKSLLPSSSVSFRRALLRLTFPFAFPVTFISYLNQLYSPLNRIASLYRQTMQSLVDTEQLMSLLSEEKDILDRPNSVELEIDPDKGEGGDIEFRDVTFSYDGKKDVLKGISFKVEKGQSVALVGSSGGGKSTVMRLLYRFHEATQGGIYVNGHDIRDITQQSLRFNIGLVPQGKSAASLYFGQRTHRVVCFVEKTPFFSTKPPDTTSRTVASED
jgi:ATP-binding cassette subfamily B (MDR/TAP) protein 6